MSKLAIKGGEPVRKKPLPDNECALYPRLGEEEIEAVKRVIRSHNLSSNFGHEVEKFESSFASYCDAEFAIAVSSGTTALHTALGTAGIGVGDEVIVPPYTFLSTATSVLMQNAIPVFADIEPDTLGLDPEVVHQKTTPRTKAIILVHMNGYPADMDGLMAVAQEHNLVVIEDCSHAHGAEYRRRKVGTIGDFGVFSFQQKKILSLGEGGMVITKNPELAKKARAFRSFGDDVSLAYNYRMTELHAAIGRVRLARLDQENAQRIRNAEYLNRNLDGLIGIRPQKPRQGTKTVYYNYVIRYFEKDLGVSKEKFIAGLKAEGIPLPPRGLIYYPLYRHRTFMDRDTYGHGCPFTCPFYNASDNEKPSYKNGTCPVAERICDKENIEVKIHPPASPKDMADIVNAFNKVVNNIEELKSYL